ncbi:GlcG/HbpS family heme-binding protein [Pseudomonas typographi]|uniref:Heme-binding protein n=1 Tax=Pseudomonas typographi TaxID=2715964 RepID=A0ABR7Z9T6_9PSED|nr:heme-binding protein [Pseudomonas typographi]MBD1551104.1 heme-binding protein [Pseudomonas typographi]MBD1586402.1 heme-binding protein [Pseudomonas typographi]MBD1602219.1 heme-binding protein [Pseudomonas typographi]
MTTRIFTRATLHGLTLSMVAALAIAAMPRAFAADASGLLRPATDLSLQGASLLLEQAITKATTDHVHPCIAIADASGNLLAFKRMDGAPPGCVRAAIKKANSAAINGVDTVVFYDLARQQNLQLGSIPGILPAVAGVVIRQQGEAVGSLGIAGGAGDAQEQQFASDLVRTFEKSLPAR